MACRSLAGSRCTGACTRHSVVNSRTAGSASCGGGAVHRYHWAHHRVLPRICPGGHFRYRIFRKQERHVAEYTDPGLTSREQLRAGQLGRRIPQLLIGLFLFGWSMAMMVESDLGLMPWDVFHQGVANYLPLTFGQVVILVGALVLLLWIPLRQWPGLGTILNVVLIGLSLIHISEPTRPY